MRKLKLQVQISIDGFVAGSNAEMDWMVWDWDDQLKEFTAVLTAEVGTILLGRNMADGFINHWTNVSNQKDDPEFEFAKKMVDTPKIVFSTTLNKSNWENTIVANDPEKEIKKIKNKSGGDIIVYGGAAFVSSLIKSDLIDEYNLFTNPAILGTGRAIFNEVEKPRILKLIKSNSYTCGIVVNTYSKIM